MAGPEGLLLTKGKRKWRVGRQLGSGACGTVHELKPKDSTDRDDETGYVVKIAPVPPVAANPKKKKTEAQMNADLMYYESLVYHTHLPSLQGKLIPMLPRKDKSSPPCNGDVDGYRFLVMERMAGSLMEAVPLLMKQHKSKKKIPFGPVACALVTCIEAVHDQRMLFVDVKPENFMLARSAVTLEKRIRMIDLGLVKPIRDTSGQHKQNEGGQLVGTPLYSSLNAHRGETLSRRDDLEALGYLIAELLLVLLQQAVRGSKSKSEEVFPWSNGKSEDDIFRIKQAQVTDPKSDFYASLSVGGNEHIAKCLWSYLSEIWTIGFKKKPDYGSLKFHLKGLDVLVGAKASLKNNPKRASGRAGIATAPINVDSDSEPEESAARVTRPRRAAKRSSGQDRSSEPSKSRRVEKDDNSEAEVIAMDISDEEESKDVGMELEEVSDENNAPSSNAASASECGVLLLVSEGPHLGETFVLQSGTTDTVVLGSNPRSRNGGRFVLSNDSDLEASHVKLVLAATKKVCSVRVVDLKSGGSTYVNSTKVAKGKEHRAFINDEIHIGDTTLKIQPLKAAAGKPRSNQTKAKKTAGTRASSKSTANKNQSSATKVKSGGPGVRLVFIEGPHKEEVYSLTQGEVETVVLGTNPKVKSAETFCLADDEADASHVKLELVASKNMISVQVTDLKSQTGTFVNGKQIPKGKFRRVFMNDTIQVGDSVIKVSPL